MGTCGIPLRAVHTTLLAGSHSYPIILLGLITGINLKKKKKKSALCMLCICRKKYRYSAYISVSGGCIMCV